MRVGLVGCTKSKLVHRASAEHLYSDVQGPAYVGQGEPAIAGIGDVRKHDLLAPSDLLEPYDVTLVGAPIAVKRGWAAVAAR